MEDVQMSGKQLISGYNPNIYIYIPFSTALVTYGIFAVTMTSGTMEATRVEIDELYIRVNKNFSVPEVSLMIKSILTAFHKEDDYELIVPLELLRHSQKIQQIFNIVMGSIAGISLLVGGIGIMNIMLATVTERTREIGIRRALGARKIDIIKQFLTETIVLSSIGGLLGLGLGIIGAKIIVSFTPWSTIITLWSLILSFSISCFTGIIFGIYPAQKAANMNPVEALRYE
jgi:putative ABC transport system permease protein